MYPRLALPIFLVCLLSATAVHAEDVDELLNVIQSPEASDVDRANAFEKIGDIAGDDAVGPLAAYLSNDKWSHYARFALQKMKGERVTEALLQSLDTLQGDLKLGVIDSIGRRGDPQAVRHLANLLTQADTQIAAAAAAALGAIGTEDAASVLTEALRAEKNPGRRESLASALLLVGQQLAKSGHTDAALETFDLLRVAEVPKPYKIGATDNAIRLRGAGGTDLMMEQLKSPDRDYFQTGLALARELPGERATRELTDLLKTEALAERQALLILALRDREDRQAIDAITEKLRSDSPAVQLAAIDAIGSLGDDSSVPVLLSVVNDDNSEAVLHALVDLRGGPRVNATLMKAAKPPGTSAVAVRALGQRRAKDAVSLLLQLSESDSETISQEAIVALGKTVSQDRFLDLIALLKTSKTDDRKASIREAIDAAVFRSTQPDASAEALAAMIPISTGTDREFLFEQIRQAGGDKAVAIMREFATGTDEQLQDEATKTLGRWLSADAAPVLLEVAQGDGKFANRALGGYIRIYRQFELPESKRVVMAAQALNTASRSNERNAAIDAMTRFPCVGTFELALEQLDAPGSEAAAAKAILTIGRTVLDLDPETGKAGLQKLIDADVNESTTNAAKALLR